MNMQDDKALSRRDVLKLVGAAPAALLVVGACGGSGEGGGGGGRTASVLGASAGAETATETVAWAAGGVGLITAAYPATSIFESANVCTLETTPALMEGPCYFAVDTGEDITDGRTGLPMQLCVQVQDSNCNPVANQTVEVWHADARGVYSGDTSQSSDSERFDTTFCTNDDEQALASTYLRGQLTTDSEGRVNFKTVLPGWYAGRTIHIHFAIAGADGQRRVVSQWCFPDDLADDIYTNHPEYSARGLQDTSLGADDIFSARNRNDLMLSTRQNSDGTLLTYGVVRLT